MSIKVKKNEHNLLVIRLVGGSYEIVGGDELSQLRQLSVSWGLSLEDTITKIIREQYEQMKKEDICPKCGGTGWGSTTWVGHGDNPPTSEENVCGACNGTGRRMGWTEH
jgi:DnaJ-class molecular chaperone